MNETEKAIIKVCGLRESDNYRAVDRLGPDWLGFIFYPPSPRYVGADFELEGKVSAKRVGVFVNEALDSIRKIADKCKLSYLQLHGDESPEYCAELSDQFFLIKAFGIDEDFDFSVLNQYDMCEYFLFDTKTKDRGGSGESYDWNLLNAYEGSIPFLLSGGLSMDNLEAAAEFSHPQLAGFDLNSGFEIEPALKNLVKLKEGFDLLR